MNSHSLPYPRSVVKSATRLTTVLHRVRGRTFTRLPPSARLAAHAGPRSSGRPLHRLGQGAAFRGAEKLFRIGLRLVRAVLGRVEAVARYKTHVKISVQSKRTVCQFEYLDTARRLLLGSFGTRAWLRDSSRTQRRQGARRGGVRSSTATFRSNDARSRAAGRGGGGACRSRSRCSPSFAGCSDAARRSHLTQ